MAVCWLIWDAEEAVAAFNSMEFYYCVPVRRWLALYGMLVWQWLPYMGCWYGGGCLIWVAGEAVAAVFGMLVWRWLPYMGCWSSGGCFQ